MSELAPQDKSHNLPPHVQEIRSSHGSVVINVSPRGGQIWCGQINGRDIILPLESAHSISTDPRPNPNPYLLGETTKPGGSWLSFGGGLVRNMLGKVISKAPVHGPFSAASNLFRYLLKADRISLDGGVEGVAPFFLPDQRFGVCREVAAIEGENDANGAIEITNIITNRAPTATIAPKAVEHAYFTSQAAGIDQSSGERIATPVAAIWKASGELTYPESLEHVEPGNGNVIDAHFDSTEAGTPGRCIFLPDGEGGRVVTVDAIAIRDDGSWSPITQFDIYRHLDDDPWTAIEPAMEGVHLNAGESVSMITTIRSYDSLDLYMAAQAA